LGGACPDHLLFLPVNNLAFIYKYFSGTYTQLEENSVAVNTIQNCIFCERKQKMSFGLCQLQHSFPRTINCSSQHKLGGKGEDALHSNQGNTKGYFTLWPKVERPSIFTNHIAQSQEFGLLTFHIKGQSLKAVAFQNAYMST